MLLEATSDILYYVYAVTEFYSYHTTEFVLGAKIILWLGECNCSRVEIKASQECLFLALLFHLFCTAIDYDCCIAMLSKWTSQGKLGVKTRTNTNQFAVRRSTDFGLALVGTCCRGWTCLLCPSAIFPAWLGIRINSLLATSQSINSWKDDSWSCNASPSESYSICYRLISDLLAFYSILANPSYDCEYLPKRTTDHHTIILQVSKLYAIPSL